MHILASITVKVSMAILNVYEKAITVTARTNETATTQHPKISSCVLMTTSLVTACGCDQNQCCLPKMAEKYNLSTKKKRDNYKAGC